MSDEKIIIEVDEFLADLIPGFMENRRADIEKLAVAISAADYEAIRHIAHDLKGLGAGYGFQRITDIGVMLSDAAKRKDVRSLRQLAEQYEAYLTGVEIKFV